MKTGLTDDGNLNPKPLNARFSKQFSVFFVFVLAASLIWLIIKLSEDFTSTLSYRVEYKNVPAGQILMGISDSSISLGLDARGFDLINYRLLKKKPLVRIDLSRIKIQSRNHSHSGILLTSGLTRKIALQIGSHNEVLYILPDTLKFEFMPEHSKRVPVKPLIQYQLRPQFMLYDSIKANPDIIWVYGSREMLDSIFSVRTIPRSFPELHESQKLNLMLQKPAGLPLTYSDNEVEVGLWVEQFTEKSFELPIKVICPDTIHTLKIFPETVMVHCFVALKDYKRIDPSMFKASVSCYPDELLSSSKLRVKISEYPSYVRISRKEPERVEYLLVKSAQ